PAADPRAQRLGLARQGRHQGTAGGPFRLRGLRVRRPLPEPACRRQALPVLDGRPVEKRKKPVHEGPCADDGFSASRCGLSGTGSCTKPGGGGTGFALIVDWSRGQEGRSGQATADTKQEQSKADAGSPSSCDFPTAERFRSSRGFSLFSTRCLRSQRPRTQGEAGVSQTPSTP